MRKQQQKWMVIGAVLAAGLIGAGGHAQATTIKDHTWVLEGHSRSDQVADWVDVIGDPALFNVRKVKIKEKDEAVLFKLRTNFKGKSKLTTDWDHTTYYTYLADLALDLDSDGTFDLGVVLRDHDKWKKGVEPTAAHLDTGLYRATAWDTSATFMEEVAPRCAAGDCGGIGYGEWSHIGDDLLEPVVAVADGELLDPFVISRKEKKKGGYEYSFVLERQFLGDGDDPITLFWSGDSGASDPIAGTFTLRPMAESEPVPEPATLLLLGSGLAGLCGWRRRRGSQGTESASESPLGC